MKNEYIQDQIYFYKTYIEQTVGIKMNILSKFDIASNWLGKIYPEQILGSLILIHNFIKAKNDPNFSRYNIIFAETQSGKTGVGGNIMFLLEAYDKLRNYLGIEFYNSFF